MNNKFLFFIFIFLILISSSVHSYEINSYVEDNAGVFDEDIRLQLVDNLQQFEKESGGVQIVVFTEDNIPDGTTLEERTLQLAEERGLGDKDKDNGILFYLATNDRKFRWEVGYGLEPTLNTAWLGRMSRDTMIPQFKEANYAGGILEGLIQVESKILGNETIVNSATPNSDKSFYEIFILGGLTFLSRHPGLIIVLIIMIFLWIIMIKSMLRQSSNPINNGHYINSATNLFGGFGGGSFGGGGFSGGGGSFGGGGFSGGF